MCSDNHVEGKMATNTKDEDIILTEEQLRGWFLHAVRPKAVIPLEAVKSMATVKLSCVLVGEGAHQIHWKQRCWTSSDSRIILTPR